jgi:hypothetical protein
MKFTFGIIPKKYVLRYLLNSFASYGCSVADPDPGSGIGCFLTPGSGIRNRFFPDPGSQIPDPKTIFLRAFRQFFW